MLHRLRQGVGAILLRVDAGSPAVLERTSRTARMFAALSRHDRRHLLAVHSACVAERLPDDVATAGLLHDIGKASLSGRRVTLVDRALNVLLGRVSPAIHACLARETAGGATLGIQLARHHPTLGAGRLAALGWPSTVTDLVRDHASADPSDDLAALRRIDDATP